MLERHVPLGPQVDARVVGCHLVVEVAVGVVGIAGAVGAVGVGGDLQVFHQDVVGGLQIQRVDGGEGCMEEAVFRVREERPGT